MSPVSRKHGKDNMLKGLQRKFDSRFRDSPSINPELEEKFKLRKLLKPRRAKSHNTTPKRFQRKQKNEKK